MSRGCCDEELDCSRRDDEHGHQEHGHQEHGHHEHGHHEHGHHEHGHHEHGHRDDGPCRCRCHDVGGGHGGHGGDGCECQGGGTDGDGGNGHGGNGHGHGDDAGTTIGWTNPGRPRRHCGTSTGELPGGVLNPKDFDPRPPNEWPGQRGDLFLPFLFLRANPGDLAARPVVGPFWESPDILLLAGVDPAVAPRIPPALGQTANANEPNTVYAHVWNFGLSSAPCVVVEFYWCDPTLGVNAAGTHLIGVETVSLGARGSGRSHAVVKCPTAWVPTFLNGGHECLVVRVWDETSDGLGTPPWDAALNRHVGQRNIHVVESTGMHAMARSIGEVLEMQAPLAPLTLKVGPLYGAPATVAVARAAPHEMPWLQLHTGVRGQFPAQAMPTGTVLLSAPRGIGSGAGGALDTSHEVTGDDQQVGFHVDDAPPKPGEAHVYRVTASQDGQVFGGYTVVLIG